MNENGAELGLSLQVDPDLRVVEIRVTDTEKLRRPEALHAAVDAAYLTAVGRRVAETQPATTPPGLPVAKTPQAYNVRPPTPEMLTRHRVREEFAQTGRAGSLGTTVGTSRNACLIVRIGPATPRGEIDADPGWLSQTSAKNLTAALNEAFTDAYARRD